MTRPPVHGDAIECRDTGAVFSVVGVRSGAPAFHPLTKDARFSIAMVCVVGPTCDWGDRPKLGDMHHIGGTWESLEYDYVLLTA